MKEDYIVFGGPRIEEDEIEEVVKTLRSGWIGTGPKVREFENEFAKYIGADFAIAVNSCTAALHLSLIAYGIGEGDEVIVPVLTFAASANVVLHCGATPVFVDVDKEHMTIDIEDVKRKITSKTKAIIPVHFAGMACDMKNLKKLADRNNLVIINDAAHAIETEYYGEKIGSLTDISCFSFYVTKNLITGEGGMITTNNEEIAQKLRIYSLHGMSKDAWKRFSDDGYKHYQVVYPGYKYNMTDLQASLGLHQLKKIDKYAIIRSKIWTKLKEGLKDLPLVLPTEPMENIIHAKHLFIILLDLEKVNITRDQLMEELHKRNIGTGVHYISLHKHPFYKEKYGFCNSDFPVADYISDRTLSLPFSAKLKDDEVDYIIQILKDVLGS